MDKIKLELNKTQVRAILARMAIGAAYSRGGSYAVTGEGIFKELQEKLGERCDLESSNWFIKGGKPVPLKWGIWRKCPICRREF